MFTDDELDIIFKLAAELTGTNQESSSRHASLACNVSRRMQQINMKTLAEYLNHVQATPGEYDTLISNLTIHTTSWFRESPHFDFLRDFVVTFHKNNPDKIFTIWSAASSTGEEIYTIALILESVRVSNPTFEYLVFASDIDVISVNTAKLAIYSDLDLPSIPQLYHRHLLKGAGKSSGYFTLSQDIRKRCNFGFYDLTQSAPPQIPKFPLHVDFVFCRNVLIYFTQERVKDIIRALLDRLDPKGHLCLGHSESIIPEKYGLRLVTNSIYRFISEDGHVTDLASVQKKKVLVVDNSIAFRSALSKPLKAADYMVFGASSLTEASKFLEENPIDLITLDLNMAHEDSHEWLKRLRDQGSKIPVFIISDGYTIDASSVIGALQKGAQDFVEKSKLHVDMTELLDRFKQILLSHQSRYSLKTSKPIATSVVIRPFFPDLILVGASTGGPQALTELFKKFPKACPPVLIVQHIAKHFAEAFAKRLALLAELPLGECLVDGPLRSGHIYMALGDYHIGVRRTGDLMFLKRSNSEPINLQRPSVDYLFQTATQARVKTLAILLTGMGKDGAQGMVDLKGTGSVTIAQDEKSSSVFGMPKAAIDMGGTCMIGNLTDIRRQLELFLAAERE